MKLWSAVQIVARREITTRVQSKGFVIPTLITVGLLLIVGVIGPQAVKAFSSETTVAVTTELEPTITELGEDFEAVVVTDDSAAREAVANEEVDAAVVAAPESPAGVKILADREEPGDLMMGLSIMPEVEILDPNAVDPTLVSFIGMGFGLVFFMTALMFGMVIAQSVVEEKQTRIVEILLAAIPARAILLGKIIGNTLLAFGQILLYALAVLLTIAVNGEQLNLDGLGTPILWFILLFTISFIMLAAFYGGGASLVSRQEDIGSATSTLNILVMLPYFLVVFFANNLKVLTVLSFVPFSSAIAVPMRAYLNEIALWEILVIIGINLVAMWVAIALAAHIYERAVLRMGKAWSWVKALRA